MSSADYFRLVVLCLWLLDGDVSCENTQKGYVLRVQAGQAPMGVHGDDRDYTRWRELPDIFKIPTAGFTASSVDRRQSGNMNHAQQGHTTDSKSLQSQSRYPHPVIPETKNSNFPKSQVNHFKSDFSSASLTQGQNPVVNLHSGNKASSSPDSKKIHQANFGSVFSTGAAQVPPLMYHVKTQLTGGFSSVQVDKATIGFGQNNKEARIYADSSAASPNIQDVRFSSKPESRKFFINPSRPHRLHPQEPHLTIRPEMTYGYDPASLFPNSFNHARPNLLQKDLQPINKKMNSGVTGYSAGSNLAGKVDPQMSRPTWSQRFYGGAVMAGARGYAHVRHIKPYFDKTRPQAGSSAGRKFLETGTRGNKPGSRPPPPTDRAQTPVQGKFKPFQRLPTSNDLSAHTNSSDNETAPSQTFAGTTLPPSLNSTGITSSAPSVKGEVSTKSAPPLLTEGKGPELIPPASNPEGQSESAAGVGLSLEQNKPFTVSPPKLKPADKEEKGDKVVSSPLENDQSKA